MIIIRVQYSKLTNLGNYENEKIAAWANVESDEEPEEALAALREWVDDQGNTSRQLSEQRGQLMVSIADLQTEAHRIENHIFQLRAARDIALKWLKDRHIDAPAAWYEDVPF